MSTALKGGRSTHTHTLLFELLILYQMFLCLSLSLNLTLRFESANGIKVEDQGSIKSIKVPKLDDTGRQIGEEDVQVSVQTGSFQYTAPDGQVYTLR